MIIRNLTKLFICAIFFFIFSNSFSQNKHNSERVRKSVYSKTYIIENEENDSKVVKLGNNIQNAILDSDIDAFMSSFDTKSFGELIVADVEEDGTTKQFKSGFLKGIKGNISAIPKRIITEIEAGSYYDFVNYRYEKDDKSYYMLFRIYSPETGINYHDYKVSQLNEKLVFKDIYIYLSGEKLSKTLKRFYLYSLPKKSLFKFFGENNTKEFLNMVDAVNLYNKGEFINAHNKFKEIKGELKNDKFFLIIKSVCASNVNENEYQKSMEEILNAYPNDTSLYLSQIDYHIMNKNYDTAHTLLDRLQKDTSDDFLNLLKGNLEFEKKNYDKALEYFKNISDNYPDFFEGHSSYLSCLAIKKDFETCIKFLSILVNEGFEKTDLIEYIEVLDDDGENTLEDLATSEIYNDWKKE